MTVKGRAGSRRVLRAGGSEPLRSWPGAVATETGG